MARIGITSRSTFDSFFASQGKNAKDPLPVRIGILGILDILEILVRLHYSCMAGGRSREIPLSLRTMRMGQCVRAREHSRQTNQDSE